LPPRTEFSNVRVTGPVEDGVFSNDDMLIELPFLRMTGNGTVNLAEGQIDYGMQARVLASPDLAGATSESELDDLTGTIIPLSITGPLADPKIRLDVEEMLEAEAKRAVEKEADKLKNRLLGSLIGGSGQTADDEAGGEEDEQTEEEEKPEKKLKNALKKLFDR
jgi:AsmA protein